MSPGGRDPAKNKKKSALLVVWKERNEKSNQSVCTRRENMNMDGATTRRGKSLTDDLKRIVGRSLSLQDLFCSVLLHSVLLVYRCLLWVCAGNRPVVCSRLCAKRRRVSLPGGGGGGRGGRGRVCLVWLSRSFGVVSVG